MGHAVQALLAAAMPAHRRRRARARRTTRPAGSPSAATPPSSAAMMPRLGRPPSLTRSRRADRMSHCLHCRFYPTC